MFSPSLLRQLRQKLRLSTFFKIFKLVKSLVNHICYCTYATIVFVLIKMTKCDSDPALSSNDRKDPKSYLRKMRSTLDLLIRYRGNFLLEKLWMPFWILLIISSAADAWYSSTSGLLLLLLPVAKFMFCQLVQLNLQG